MVTVLELLIKLLPTIHQVEVMLYAKSTLEIQTIRP